MTVGMTWWLMCTLQMKGSWESKCKCLVLIYIFPKMKLLFPKQNYNVLSPYSYTLIYLWEIYIFPGSVCLFCCREICGPILGIYKLLSDTHECGNWDWDRAISRKGMHNWDFPCSVVYFPLICGAYSAPESTFGCMLFFIRHIFQCKYVHCTLLGFCARGQGKWAKFIIFPFPVSNCKEFYSSRPRQV